MGVMEKIKEIEAEMARTVSNLSPHYFSVIFLFEFDVITLPLTYCTHLHIRIIIIYTAKK